MNLSLRELWQRLNGTYTEAHVITQRQEVHDTLNKVQGDVLRARNTLNREHVRHAKTLEETSRELGSIAERIARATQP